MSGRSPLGLTVPASSNMEIVIAIKSYYNKIISARGIGPRFDIIVEFYTYLYDNYHFLDSFPPYKEAVYKRLNFFISENIPEWMKQRLMYFRMLLFSETISYDSPWMLAGKVSGLPTTEQN